MREFSETESFSRPNTARPRRIVRQGSTDNVIQAVERSLEFLILGGLALGLVASLCGLPTLGRWVATWNAHVSLVTQRPDDHSHVSESQATAHMAFAGILFFSMTYVLGFLISDLGAWALQPAHLDVIRATHQFVCSKEQAPNPLDPSGRFWLLPFRHFCSLPPDYYGALRGEDERQQYWQMYQTASYNDALGPLFKQIRFVRGLSFLSLSAALVVLPISIVRWIKGARNWRTCF